MRLIQFVDIIQGAQVMLPHDNETEKPRTRAGETEQSAVSKASGIYESDVHLVDIGAVDSDGYLSLPLDDDPETSLQENILPHFPKW